MKDTHTTKAILTLAQECISLEMKERPELQWLKSRHASIQKKYNLKNKQETDRFLYQRMYGHSPEKNSEILKMRYWRTGQYTPGNREQCILFGKALELSAEEMQYLLQNYYDRNMNVYDVSIDSSDSLYMQRKEYMKKLTDTYIQNIPLERIVYLNVPADRPECCLRHLYFTDAFHYVHSLIDPNSELLVRHISSARYDSEFKRQLKLLGEIPRKTMLRHLIILNLPHLTLDKINQQLSFFGYLPLCEDHTMVNGERLDWLLIRLILLYEEMCMQEELEDCLAWFQEACRTLDQFFAKSGKRRLRFMHFKALELR